MRPFDPYTLRVGEVLRTWSDVARKPKYQLCVRAVRTRGDIGLVLINTGKPESRGPGHHTVNWKRVLLPRPKTALTEFDFTMVWRYAPAALPASAAIVFPSIGRSLARELAQFVNDHVKTLVRQDKRELIDALLSIEAEDPTPAMHRALRASLYAASAGRALRGRTPTPPLALRRPGAAI